MKTKEALPKLSELLSDYGQGYIESLPISLKEKDKVASLTLEFVLRVRRELPASDAFIVALIMADTILQTSFDIELN
jgi:hypothetical protein